MGCHFYEHLFAYFNNKESPNTVNVTGHDEYVFLSVYIVIQLLRRAKYFNLLTRVCNGFYDTAGF